MLISHVKFSTSGLYLNRLAISKIYTMKRMHSCRCLCSRAAGERHIIYLTNRPEIPPQWGVILCITNELWRTLIIPASRETFDYSHSLTWWNYRGGRRCLLTSPSPLRCKCSMRTHSECILIKLYLNSPWAGSVPRAMHGGPISVLRSRLSRALQGGLCLHFVHCLFLSLS